MCKPPNPLQYVSEPNNRDLVPKIFSPVFNSDLYESSADWDNENGGDFSASTQWHQQLTSSGVPNFQQQFLQHLQGPQSSSVTSFCSPSAPSYVYNLANQSAAPNDLSLARSVWERQSFTMNKENIPGTTSPAYPRNQQGYQIPSSVPMKKSSSVMADPVVTSLCEFSNNGPQAQQQQVPPSTWTTHREGNLDSWIMGAISGNKRDKPCEALLPRNWEDRMKTENGESVDEGSDGDEVVREKKMRRMLSNRASAKRSRQRRQERLGELEIMTAKLRVENASVTRKYNEAIEMLRRYQQVNEDLRSELEQVQSGSGVASQRFPSANMDESGKTSAHSMAVPEGPIFVKVEHCNEELTATSEGDYTRSFEEKKSVTSLGKVEAILRDNFNSKENSPSSGVSSKTQSPSKELHSLTIPLDCVMMEESKGLELATDEWFDSLVQSLDE